MARKKRNSKIEPNLQMGADFKGLITTPGWARLVQILDENIEVMEKQVLEKVSLDGLPLTEQDCDELRFKIGHMKELEELPNKMIEKSMITPPVEEDTDPYQK